MKICMVSHHGCIRVWKEAQMLMDEGHTVAVVSDHMHGMEITRYHSFTKYFDASSLARAVQLYDEAGFDLFHVHNEPDWIVSVTRNNTTKPVIFDVHDLESARLSVAVTMEELVLMRQVDGVIHVSQEMAEYSDRIHRHRQPVEVIHTFTPAKLMVPAGQVRAAKRIPKSVVYEGGITRAFEEPMKSRDYTGRNETVQKSYRDYGIAFKALIKAGYNVHIYPCEMRDEDIYGYRVIGCTIHEPIPIYDLIPEMTQYEWSFVGCATPVPILDKAMPNKLFESMAAGCVPIVYCGKAAERWCLENGFGVSLDTLDSSEIQYKAQNAPEYRERFLMRRDEFTMESQYDRLMDFYENVFEYHAKKIKEDANV